MGGALMMAAPGAHAADYPTPPAPTLLDATVTGCNAPCAPGESGQVELTIQLPDPDLGGLDWVYANGQRVQPNASGTDADHHLHLWFSICSGIRQPFEGCVDQQQVDAVRGAETFAATSIKCTSELDPVGYPIPGTTKCSDESPMGNALVPRQL